jgi:hypothetical protein
MFGKEIDFDFVLCQTLLQLAQEEIFTKELEP